MGKQLEVEQLVKKLRCFYNVGAEVEKVETFNTNICLNKNETNQLKGTGRSNFVASHS